jgi:uncharacterized repeat protein (TIGR03803 family)
VEPPWPKSGVLGKGYGVHTSRGACYLPETGEFASSEKGSSRSAKNFIAKDSKSTKKTIFILKHFLSMSVCCLSHSLGVLGGEAFFWPRDILRPCPDAARHGGNHSCIGGSACGTVFKTDPVTGATSVLYRFAGGADGAHPYAALTYQGGMIYGTTAEGGGTACYGRHGCGTAFQIDPKTGTETVLYRFTGGADGDFPASPLTYLNGTLYGTTFDGGHHGCRRDGGCGTFYGLSAATGAKTVLLPLHPSTGEGPFLGLTLHGDRIYGAAGNGGAGGAGVNGCDCGTVFAFKP